MKEFNVTVDFHSAEWVNIEDVLKPEQWAFKALDENRAIELFLEKIQNNGEINPYFKNVNFDKLVEQISCHLAAKECVS